MAYSLCNERKILGIKALVKRDTICYFDHYGHGMN
jgi:hypothetical protein